MKPENLHKRPAPLSVGLVHRAAAQRGAFHRFSGAPCVGNCGCRFPRAPWCFAQSIFRELQVNFWEGHWLWAGTTSKLTNHFLQSLTELRACCPLHSPEKTPPAPAPSPSPPPLGLASRNIGKDKRAWRVEVILVHRPPPFPRLLQRALISVPLGFCRS